jgi:hypothetical protein
MIFAGIGLLLMVGAFADSSASVSDFQRSQAAKDDVSGHDVLLSIFERVQFFLQRLKIHNSMPLTIDMIKLLGKIMAQVLSVLACSMKEMGQHRLSEPNYPICVSWLNMAQRSMQRT